MNNTGLRLGCATNSRAFSGSARDREPSSVDVAAEAAFSTNILPESKLKYNSSTIASSLTSAKVIPFLRSSKK